LNPPTGLRALQLVCKASMGVVCDTVGDTDTYDMQKSLPKRQALPLFVSEQGTWPIAASPFGQ